ncbi:MAG: asparagine synthase (glutamine-hydrolyzing), partial [Bacteroidetes bacterium]|nr:asparagine synthase (glutamine-hydrolyzing) [Bacteroidota bacterium]
MCGVAGIIDYQGRYNDRTAVGSMLRSISYRGPDESGIYVSNAATLGNVRLSIIDLLTGQQPLSDPTGRYWIVHNGEIFNYRELKRDLEADGEKFITQSDTEVIVHLYALHGPKCLSLLNGQFAFAVWDKQKEELFIARDRVGIRPLFYNLKNGVFSFASEIKALLTQKTISPKLRVQSLSQIFTFWTTLTPYTAFEDIFELPPGHYLTFNRQGLTITKYWDLDYSRTDKEIKLNDAAEQLEELLKNAVRLRLRADVKVAAYLSGGIDSSATTAFIKDIEPGILNTFSIGFDEKDFDESRYQKEAVEY